MAPDLFHRVSGPGSERPGSQRGQDLLELLAYWHRQSEVLFIGWRTENWTERHAYRPDRASSRDRRSTGATGMSSPEPRRRSISAYQAAGA
jgi:hypothetical protein